MNPLVVHSGLYAGSAVFLRAAGFAFFLWLARTLTVDDYASWGLLYALQTAVTSFGLVGIVEAIIGLLASNRTPIEQRRLFAAANTVFLATSVGSMLFGSMLYFVSVDDASGSQVTIAYVLASGGLLAYVSLQAQIVRLEERHLASLYFNFVAPMCGLGGSFVAFWLSPTVQSFFLGSAVGLAMSMIPAAIGRLGFFRLSGEPASGRSIVSRLLPFVAVTFLGWFGGYGNSYVIDFFFASTDVAMFTFAFMLSSIMQLIATATNQVWSPRFYRLIHEVSAEEVERQSQRFFWWQSIALGSTGCGLLIAYPAAVNVLGGSLAHYESLSLQLLLLVVSYVVLTPWWHCQNYLLAYDHGPSVMRILIATSIVGVAALAFWLLIFGPLGIYIGFLTQMILRSAGALLVSRKRWSVRVSWGGVVAGLALAFVGFLVSLDDLG